MPKTCYYCKRWWSLNRRSGTCQEERNRLPPRGLQVKYGECGDLQQTRWTQKACQWFERRNDAASQKEQGQ